MSNVENILSLIFNLRPFQVEVIFRGIPGQYQCRIVSVDFTHFGQGVTLEEAIRHACTNYERWLKDHE